MGVKINGYTIASKLRKMLSSNGQTVASNLDGEAPSGNGVLYVNIIPEKTRAVPARLCLDKCYKEIYDAVSAGKAIIGKLSDEGAVDGFIFFMLQSIGYFGVDGYIVLFYSPNASFISDFVSKTDTGIMYMSVPNSDAV